MDYLQLKSLIQSDNLTLTREILTFELSQLGFESFSDFTDGLIAYIKKDAFNKESLNNITFHNELNLGNIQFSWEIIKDQNWNAEWEKNFSPVLIADTCYIRAPFHAPIPDVPYEIVIEPKMSFGTGHHETTSLMMEQMFALDFTGKNVLDMGSGTGILAILASKLKAKHVLAIDIEDWAFHNSIENKAINKISNMEIELGDVQRINNKTFDIILANINRNILLADIPAYSNSLLSGGNMLISGIYSFDLDMIRKCAENCQLIFEKCMEKNEWISVLFKKA